MSNNPSGRTGKRSVRYIKPGLTQVIYEDRVLDIRTAESNEAFASKVKARTGKVPKGYKTKQEAYNERRARNKAAAEKKASQAKAAKKTSGAKKTSASRSKAKKMNALEAGLASGKYVLE